jgi:bifunctional non-homologous end joining protein LigD
MVWDQNSWLPQAGYEDVGIALKNSALKFRFAGTKLKDKKTLVRMKNTGTGSSL